MFRSFLATMTKLFLSSSSSKVLKFSPSSYFAPSNANYLGAVVSRSMMDGQEDVSRPSSIDMHYSNDFGWLKDALPPPHVTSVCRIGGRLKR